MDIHVLIKKELQPKKWLMRSRRRCERLVF